VNTQFDLKLTGYGWGEIGFASDKQLVTIVIEYVSDPLADLLQALLRIRKSESVLELVGFESEASLHQMIITEISSNIIRIEIFDNVFFDLIDDEEGIERIGSPVFSAYCFTYEFIYMICTYLQEFIANYGLDKYLEKWGRPFPDQLLSQLYVSLRS